MGLYICADCKKAIKKGLFESEVYDFDGKTYCKDCFEKNHLVEFKEKEAQAQKDTADFVATTTSELEGYRIVKYIGLYHTYEEDGAYKEESRLAVLADMRNCAVANGGNAVIGVQITNFVDRSISNCNMPTAFLSICGTIVRVEKIEA